VVPVARKFMVERRARSYANSRVIWREVFVREWTSGGDSWDGVAPLWAFILWFPGSVGYELGIKTEFVGSRGASGFDCAGDMCCIGFLGN